MATKDTNTPPSFPSPKNPEVLIWAQPSRPNIDKTACKEKRKRSLGPFHIFKDGLLEKILKFCDAHTLLQLSLVSHYFYVLCDKEEMWKKRCLRKHVAEDKVGSFQHKKSWKRTYFRPKPLPLDQIPPLRPIVISDVHKASQYSEWWRRTYPASLLHVPKTRETIPIREDLTLQKFIEEFESKNLPVIIRGGLKGWKAMEKWTPENFSKHYGSLLFKTNGQDHRGKCFRLTFDDYHAYCLNNNDPKPIYLFDNRFTERIPEIVGDWEVPAFFREDFFDAMTREDRPDWRWFLIGPEKSGSPLHQDPHRTSAWNALITGEKRWALYPPEKIPPSVDPKLIDTEYYAAPETLKWYTEIYPYLEKNELPMEGTQLPGDIIFVPSGWWHCVLNLGQVNVAVTQNFCDKQNFDLVYMDLLQKGSSSLLRDFERDVPKVQGSSIFEKFNKKYNREQILSKRKVNVSSDSDSESDDSSDSDE